MNNILDASNHKVGSIDEQGVVHDFNGKVIGKVVGDDVFSD